MNKRIVLILFFFLSSIAQAQFIVYREFFFTGQPSNAYFDGLGLKRTHGVYEDQVTGGSPPAEQQLMQSTAQSTLANYSLHENRMWYDIEYLDTAADRVGTATASANARELAKFIGWAKSAAPRLEVGLYSQVPVTDLYMSSHLAQRQAWNDLLQPLADTLDFLCPSIYLYYSESAKSYASYAVPLIQEAKRLAKGKKVFPFIAPGYHPAGDHANQYASKAVWANVLKVMKDAGADGVFIFAGQGAMGGQTGDWAHQDTSGWWAATKEFLQSLSADPVSPPPAAPTLVTPTTSAVVDPATFVALWRKVSGAVRYHLQLADNSGFTTTLVNDSTLTDTLRQVTTLASGKTYYVRVRSKGATSSWSTFAGTVPFSTAAAPTLIDPKKGSSGQPTSLKSRWNRSLGATLYQLQIAESNTFQNAEVNDSAVADTTRQVTLLKANTHYYWRVRAKFGTTWGSYSAISDFTTGSSSQVDESDNAPATFSLAQNFPNPFNPTTLIRFTLPVRSHVSVSLYNPLGQLVRDLIDSEEDAGIHEIRLDGSGLASGMYYYRMQAGTYVETKKLVLLK